MDELQNRWNLHFRSVRTTSRRRRRNGDNIWPPSHARNHEPGNSGLGNPDNLRTTLEVADRLFLYSKLCCSRVLCTTTSTAMNAPGRKRKCVAYRSSSSKLSSGTEDNEMIHAGRTPLHQCVQHCAESRGKVTWKCM